MTELPAKVEVAAVTSIAPDPGGPRAASFRTVARAVGWRPWLWWIAVVEAARLAPDGWWRSWPPVPRPADELWRFRMESAYGGAGDAVPPADDVRRVLEWCRRMGRWRRVS